MAIDYKAVCAAANKAADRVFDPEAFNSYILETAGEAFEPVCQALEPNYDQMDAHERGMRVDWEAWLYIGLAIGHRLKGGAL